MLLLMDSEKYFANLFYESNIETVESVDILNEEYEAIIKLQENAVRVNQLLIEAFGFDENGYINYPDEFSGMWIEGEVLVVSLTDTNESILDKYINWAGEYSQYIRFEEAEYSYNYLYNEADEVVEKLTLEKQIDVVSYYVSEKENEIIININSNERTGTMMSTNSFEEFDVPIFWDYETEVETTAAKTVYQIPAGTRLYNVTSERGVTAAGSGTYNGMTVLLSCGHDMPLGSTIRYLDTEKVIGNVVYRNYSNGSTGDFSFISVTNTEEFAVNTRVKGGPNITGVTYLPAVGTVVKLYGASSQTHLYGEVSEINVTLSGATGVRGMCKVTMNSNTVENGDN